MLLSRAVSRGSGTSNPTCTHEPPGRSAGAFLGWLHGPFVWALSRGTPYIPLTYPTQIKGPLHQNPLKKVRDHIQGP